MSNQEKKQRTDTKIKGTNIKGDNFAKSNREKSNIAWENYKLDSTKNIFADYINDINSLTLLRTA